MSWSRSKWRVLIGVALVTAGAWSGASRVSRGWLFPIRVGSASMAPTFYGPGLQLCCPDCRFAFRIGFDTSTDDSSFVCPNCGYFGPLPDEAEPRNGQRVRIERLSRGGPERFEVVAARSGTDASEWITKRIVGLPSEEVRIENGDLLINNRIARKTGSQIVTSAIVVNQDLNRPDSQGGSSRWRPAWDASGWTATPVGHLWRPPREHNMESVPDWLVYEHSAALPPPSQRGTPSLMWDNCPYNQSTSRVLNRVSDSLIVFNASWTGSGTIFLRRHSEDDSWVACFATATGQASLYRLPVGQEVVDGAPVAKSPPSASFPNSAEHFFLFGYWDGYFQLLHNGRKLLEHSANIQQQLATSKQPFAIAATSNSELSISNLIVARDVFYTDAYGTNRPWSLGRKLAHDEYLTLGDNSPVSRDARQDESLSVFRRDQLLGRVRMWLEP